VELWLNDKLKEMTAGFKPVIDAKRLEPNELEAAC
jgi:anaerobic magnesium-protoporphyrin IX monomethyl ester cyclase